MMNNKVSLPPISDILNSSMLPLPLPTTNVNRYTMPLPSLSLPPMSSVSLPPGNHHHNHNNNAPNNHINPIDHSNNGQRTPPSLTSYTTTNNLSRISSISSSSSSPVPSTSILNYSSLPNYQYPSKPPAHATASDKKIELPSKITVNEVSSNEKRKTRNNLPKETTYILLKWLNDHLNHPYPNNFEKNQLMMSTGLNQQQLSNWFINARRRKIKMLKQQYSIEI